MADHTSKPANSLDEYVAGNVDRNGEVIEKVYTRGKSCVIYGTAGALRVEIDPDAGQTNLNYVHILPALTRVRNLQAARFNRNESLNSEIARAVLVALSGRQDDARHMFADLRRRLLALQNLRGRLEYLAAGASVAVLLGLVVLVAWAFHVPPSPPAVAEAGAYLLLKVAWAGTLGGLMSVYLGIRKIDIEVETTWIVNSIVGASRVVFACCAAVLVYFLVAAVSTLIGLNPAANDPLMFTLGIAAGFCEMWVPNLMRALHQRRASDTTGTNSRPGGESEPAPMTRESDYAMTHAPNADLLPPSAPGL